MERENDIVCHYECDYGIQQNVFNIGKFYDGITNLEFYYDEKEGMLATDYLANDKGWFVVSDRLKKILENMNTEIQFLPIRIIEKSSNKKLSGYYIANIIRVVDALCLDKSEYFQTEIPGMGTIYTVSKYGIFSDKTDDSDVFKLSNRQEIPIFVSEKFKKAIECENITGICLREISVV